MVAGSRERKWRLAVKGKGGQSSSQSSSSFLSPPSDEVVKFAAAPVASKSRFDKHLFSGPIIFFPFLFLTWVASLYFCVVPSNRDVSSERKGRKNEKCKKKNPPSSKRTKRNLQLSAAIWLPEESVGGRREKNVRLAQVAIFHVLTRRRRAWEASASSMGSGAVLPWHFLKASSQRSTKSRSEITKRKATLLLAKVTGY